MIDLDLLASVRPQRSTAWARAWACVRGYSAWVITLATLVALLCVQIALARAERRLDAALAHARVAASQVERNARRVRSLEEQEARLRSSELALQTVRGRVRTGVAPVLALLSGAIPRDVWLDRLDVQRTEITVQGRGRSLSSLVTLANELSALSVFDGPTDLREVRHARPTTADANASGFTFTLHGRLRPAAAPTRSTRP
jgi:Tfp pilus assembly protein PilN